MANVRRTLWSVKRNMPDLRKRDLLITPCAAVLASMTFPSVVHATSVVQSKINSLNDLVLGIVTSAGVIVLAWGIFEFATAYQSHDTSQQTMSLKKVVSGIIMVAAPTIISMLK